MGKCGGFNLYGSSAYLSILYGYGGFNVNITPAFITNAVAFLENGGVYAVDLGNGENNKLGEHDSYASGAALITTLEALAFAGGMLLLVRPLLARLGARITTRENLTQNVVAISGPPPVASTTPTPSKPGVAGSGAISRATRGSTRARSSAL